MNYNVYPDYFLAESELVLFNGIGHLRWESARLYKKSNFYIILKNEITKNLQIDARYLIVVEKSMHNIIYLLILVDDV